MMAKINLIQAKDNSFYCDGIFSIGVYIKPNLLLNKHSRVTNIIAAPYQDQKIIKAWI